MGDAPGRVSIPGLNADGLLPPGRHSATVDDVRAAFVDSFPASPNRVELLEAWIGLRRDIELLVSPYRQWLDGSYVTAKLEPGDVDIVTFIDPTLIGRLTPLEQKALSVLLDPVQSRSTRRCHSFFVPWISLAHVEGHKTAQGEAFWHRWWSGVSPKAPFQDPRFRTVQKGYIEIQ